MAPITKNASKSNVKQQAKSIKATTYSTKLRSANIVTPSKDNNSKKNGNLCQAENFGIQQKSGTYISVSYYVCQIIMCFYVYSIFWVPEFLLY